MTIQQFRQDKDCQQGWDDMLKNHALLRLALETVDNAHPDREPVVGDNNGDISPVRAGIEIGLSRGYSKYSARLRLLAVAPMASEGLPESEYAPPPERPRYVPAKPKPKPKPKKQNA